MNLLKISLLALILAVQPICAAADHIVGKVVKVSDGDTVTLLVNGTKTIKVRLSEIDAPETNQPWGSKSKQALSLLIATKNVTVSTTGKDRYGRTLGTIYFQQENINKLMVQNGNAWAYAKYVADKEYFLLQDHAKTKRIGLWSLSADQITPPWEWRQKSK